MAQPNGLVRGEAAAEVHQYVDARAYGTADRLHLLDGEIGEGAIDGAPRHMGDAAVRPRRRQWVAFERCVAVADDALGGLGIFVRTVARIGPAIGIGADMFAALTTEELIDRDAERLALDVPQRLLDRAHSGKDDRATALGPEGVIIHIAPQLFDAERIFAENEGLDQVPDHAGGCGAADAVGDRGLADPGYALVGRNLDKHRMQPIDRDEIDARSGDFHAVVRALGPTSR